MRIRSARPIDASAIGRIRVAAWQAAYGAFMPADFLAELDPSANLTALRRQLAARAEPYLSVAEQDQQLLGFSVLGQPRYPAPSGCLELWALNVVPEYWRQGVGRELLRDALQQARALRADRLELWCIDGNLAAQKLYESAGFVLTGSTRRSSDLTGHPLSEVQYVLALKDG